MTTMLVAALGGFKLFPDSAVGAEPQRRLVVEIRDFAFSPVRLDVMPGDRVTWINRDIVPHTVTALDDSWDSGQLDKGSTWELVVQEGTAPRYFCRFHPMMQATLEVGTAGKPG